MQEPQIKISALFPEVPLQRPSGLNLPVCGRNAHKICDLSVACRYAAKQWNTVSSYMNFVMIHYCALTTSDFVFF